MAAICFWGVLPILIIGPIVGILVDAFLRSLLVRVFEIGWEPAFCRSAVWH